MNITPVSAQTVRISNLTNVTVPLWITGDPAIIEDVFVCIYRENSSGSVRNYSITASGDGPGFMLSSGAYTLPYSVTWNDGGAGNPSGATTAPALNNITLSLRDNARIQLDAPSNSSDCNAGSSPTARLRITISSADMDAARDGTYTGTITLLLSPT